MISKDIGKRIKFLREFNNYTRERFAEKIDISARFLYEIEMGNQGFSVNILYRISQALNVSCDYILMGKEHNKNIHIINSELEVFEPRKMAQIQDIIHLIYELASR